MTRDGGVHAKKATAKRTPATVANAEALSEPAAPVCEPSVGPAEPELAVLDAEGDPPLAPLDAPAPVGAASCAEPEGVAAATTPVGVGNPANRSFDENETQLEDDGMRAWYGREVMGPRDSGGCV